jgi:nicotinate-nucleotide adenylyltransferase
MDGLRVLYGGTFDPVHEGHLAIARSARDALEATVHLMPAADPPHRAPPGASAHDRVAMLRLALRGEPGLALDLRELGREGRSWTVDTLRALREDVGSAAPVALLVGADSFAGLPQWKEWEALFGLAHFVVASRGGTPLEDLPAPLARVLEGRRAASARALREAPAGQVWCLRQPLHPQSASDIRARIAGGRPWRHLVPDAVAAYIQAHGLYGA